MDQADEIDVFPIELRARETEYYTDSPNKYRTAFREAFVAANPKGSYYAFDVIINSRTQVEFRARDMRDFAVGGIGRVTWSGVASVPAELTRDDVERAILRAASARRAAQLADEESRIIRGYADEIRARIDLAAESQP